MEIEIRAEVRSKKNSRRLYANRGRVVSLPSTAYEAFRTDALQEIMIQRIRPQAPPYEVWCKFYLKGKKDIGLDNAIASINDILQEARVITNDEEIIRLQATKVTGCLVNKTIIDIVNADREDHGFGKE